MFDAIALFMARTPATAFTLAAELNNPRSLSCTSVTPNLVPATIAPITPNTRPYKPRQFGTPVWLDPHLLTPRSSPSGHVHPAPALPKTISGLEQWFGPSGLYPAIHIASARLGL